MTAGIVTITPPLFRPRPVLAHHNRDPYFTTTMILSSTSSSLVTATVIPLHYNCGAFSRTSPSLGTTIVVHYHDRGYFSLRTIVLA